MLRSARSPRSMRDSNVYFPDPELLVAREIRNSSMRGCMGLPRMSQASTCIMVEVGQLDSETSSRDVRPECYYPGGVAPELIRDWPE